MRVEFDARIKTVSICGCFKPRKDTLVVWQGFRNTKTSAILLEKGLGWIRIICEVWPEIRHFVEFLFTKANHQGEATWAGGDFLPMYSLGYVTACCFHHPTSPIRSEK